MKIRIVFVSLVCILLLVVCKYGNDKTVAEIYLNNHSDMEIINDFEEALFFYQDFEESKQIDTKNLYSFVLLHEKHNWYNDDDQLYHIPLIDIYEILDNYLLDYKFNLDEEWIKNCYDVNEKEIITAATGMGIGYSSICDLISIDIVDADTVKVVLWLHPEENFTVEKTSKVYITAKIVNQQVKFISCYTIRQGDQQ